MDKIDVMELLINTPEKFAELCDRKDWLTDCQLDDTMDIFEDVNLPDPAMVRAWWQGKADLPKDEPNYKQWMESGELTYRAVIAEGHYAGWLKTDMEHLARGLRQSFMEDDASDEAAHATEAGPDWPPQSSAFSYEDGYLAFGSTGQLWEVRDQQWVRIESPTQEQAELALKAQEEKVKS